MTFLIKKSQKFNCELLYHRRRMMGLTLSAIGKKLDLSMNAIARWEAGTCNPSPKSLFKLAKLLKVGVAELFDASY